MKDPPFKHPAGGVMLEWGESRAFALATKLLHPRPKEAVSLSELCFHWPPTSFSRRSLRFASNPWAGDETEGGSDFEIIPVGADPTQKAEALQNAITIRGSTSSLSPLFQSLPPIWLIGSLPFRPAPLNLMSRPVI